MPQADGTILIDTEINADGMKAGSKEVEAAVRRMAASVDDMGTKARTALNKQVDAFAKMNNEYAAQAKKVDDLKRKVSEYASQKIPTREYADIQKQITEAEQKMNRLIAAQEKFVATGGSKNSKTYKRYQYEIEELANTIKYATAELKELEASGKAFTMGNKAKQAAADMEKLAAAERKLADLNNRLGTSYSSIKGRVNDYKNDLINAGQAQNKAAAAGNNVSNALKATGKSANSASFGIGKMLGTSILFSFAFQAINAALTGIKDGFGNLAQYSATTNNSISMLWGSLERLKNSLATAFAPILNVVAPILSKFIDMLSTAASYVSMFFAFLSGKSTYTRAIAVQKDYAASLNDTKKSSKERLEQQRIMQSRQKMQQMQRRKRKKRRKVISLLWMKSISTKKRKIKILLVEVPDLAGALQGDPVEVVAAEVDQDQCSKKFRSIINSRHLWIVFWTNLSKSEIYSWMDFGMVWETISRC